MTPPARRTVIAAGVFLAMLLTLSACEPMSEHAEGREDAVRYALPAGAMQLIEGADHLELLAIQRPEGTPDRGPPWFDDLDANTLARVPLPDADRRAAVASLYRAIGEGEGVGLCFEPHHALRATRGNEVLEVVLCLACSQARVGERDTFVAIHPGEVGSVWTRLLEAGSGLRFDTEAGPFGRWVERQ